jgi:hypothetical protein
VKAHGKRRFVIALKYEGETEYRYLVASDLSWRHQDIAQLYTLRWLVEIDQPYNLRKSLLTIKLPWQATAFYGRRLALTAIAPSRLHPR